MAPTPLPTAPLRVADLSQNSETTFEMRPNAAELAAIAQDMDLQGLRKLSFLGAVRAVGNSDWELVGTLGATVIQPCVVTLEPVTTRIDVPVRRQFIKSFQMSDDPEVEIPEDDAIEALGAYIDPAVVMLEALALALPLYPRKDGAHLDDAIFTEPGATPMTDEDARPFAGLAALRGSTEPDS